MDNTFEAKERLYRSVYPTEDFMKNDKTLTSVAFKDPRGLSVDRQGERTEREALTFAKSHFKGLPVSVSVQDCIDADAAVVYAPHEDNKFHSEIHRNGMNARLTKGQARYLSRVARFEEEFTLSFNPE